MRRKILRVDSKLFDLSTRFSLFCHVWRSSLWRSTNLRRSFSYLAGNLTSNMLTIKSKPLSVVLLCLFFFLMLQPQPQHSFLSRLDASTDLPFFSIISKNLTETAITNKGLLPMQPPSTKNNDLWSMIAYPAFHSP